MKPRLNSSQKWTKFPKEYINQIMLAFSEAFETQLKNGKLIIEGRIYPEEIMLRVGYLETGRLLQANFEVSMNYSSAKQDAIEKIYNCIDATASLMNEYFESNGEVEFPYSWKEFDFNGSQLFVQYSTENTALEAEADRLLGLSNEDLVKEETDPQSEDAFDHVSEKISTEDSSPPQPTIFSASTKSSKKKKENLH